MCCARPARLDKAPTCGAVGTQGRMQATAALLPAVRAGAVEGCGPMHCVEQAEEEGGSGESGDEDEDASADEEDALDCSGDPFDTTLGSADFELDCDASLEVHGAGSGG